MRGRTEPRERHETSLRAATQSSKLRTTRREVHGVRRHEHTGRRRRATLEQHRELRMKLHHTDRATTVTVGPGLGAKTTCETISEPTGEPTGEPRGPDLRNFLRESSYSSWWTSALCWRRCCQRPSTRNTMSAIAQPRTANNGAPRPTQPPITATNNTDAAVVTPVVP